MNHSSHLKCKVNSADNIPSENIVFLKKKAEIEPYNMQAMQPK
jgi:hypothetical protein